MAGSWLRYEGEIYLTNEFKAESVTYHEILRAVTEGATQWSEIENRLKTTAQLSPYLVRLERFGILKKLQPIFQEDNKRKTTKNAGSSPTTAATTVGTTWAAGGIKTTSTKLISSPSTPTRNSWKSPKSNSIPVDMTNSNCE